MAMHGHVENLNMQICVVLQVHGIASFRPDRGSR